MEPLCRLPVQGVANGSAAAWARFSVDDAFFGQNIELSPQVVYADPESVRDDVAVGDPLAQGANDASPDGIAIQHHGLVDLIRLVSDTQHMGHAFHKILRHIRL